MSNSFASLLRNSRLATYDRSINQVYTTPIKRKQVGDWGLKRNLPTVIRTRYATIKALDTAEHQTPWESGNSQVLFLKRWKENFPDSKKPAHRNDQQTYNISKMTPAQFNQFCKQISKQAPAFQRLLENKKMVPDQLYEYLKISFAESAAERPVGPTYSEYTHGPSIGSRVEGRILNSRKSGHAVGVGGVVAFLPKRHSVGLRLFGDRAVRMFYVESAHIDEEGKPKVLLSIFRPSESHFAFLPILDDDRKPPTPREQMFLTRNWVRKVMSEKPLVVGEEHNQLMSLFAKLFAQSK